MTQIVEGVPMRTPYRTALLSVLLLLVVGGCNGTAEEADTSQPAAVVAVTSTDLGDVLVDGDGMTLYLFDPDEQGPSTCDDDCAASWPPLVSDGEPVAGEGVDPALLGTAERDDGTVQVTYDGWPLYRWAADEAPGDTTGQGVGDVWWVLDAGGRRLRADDDRGAGAALDY